MTGSSSFLNGAIPSEYLYDNPDGMRAIAPSIERIRENIPWLAEQDSWIVWHWSDEAQKKPHRGADPYKKAKWQKPGNQASLEEVWETYHEYDHIDGIGFVFNGTEPEVLEDFDDCISPWLGAGVEPCLEDALEGDDEPTFFSTSGTGAHRYPVAADAEDTDQHPHEVYIGDGGNNRFAAITGFKIAGDTHGPDRSDRINELSEEYNEASGKTPDVSGFDFDADPAEVDEDAPLPDAIVDAFDGDVPRCVAGLVYVLGTHDPTEEDANWGQNTFGRYSHLLMLLADHLEPEHKELVEPVASFKSPAIAATQRGKHHKKGEKPTPYGEGVPWDLDYQAAKIGQKVRGDSEDELSPPGVETIEEHCNIKLGPCDCPVHAGSRGDEATEPAGPDPLEQDVTLDIRTAWRAASAVTADDLDEGHPLTPHDTESGAWACPNCGGAVDDVVRALALADGVLGACDATLDDPEAYDRLYTRVREDLGAPLPQYVTSATATEDMDLAFGAVGALRGWHIRDGIRSELTVEDPPGDALAVFDPVWEDSDSGERIVLFESGLFYCREHEVAFDPLRFVALEEGLIDNEAASLEGEAFLTAYRRARVDYGANLPEIVWNGPDTDHELEHIPVLPSPSDLIGEGVKTDGQALAEARAEVEQLYADTVSEAGGAYLMTVLPALGKTTSVVKQAGDEPTLYAAGRKDLMQQAMDKADEHGVSAMHLPVLGEAPPEGKLTAGVGIVRDEGREVLQDPDALLERIGDWESDEPEEDEVVLDRATCETADGEHGQAWQLAVHIARATGQRPRDIHTRARATFGEPLPCTRDGSCSYATGWEEATDPDDPVDLLIGHYVHAHVEGARVYRHRVEGRDGKSFVAADARTVAIDEFVGDAYSKPFGDDYLDHATWLARCLSDDVETRQDLLESRGQLWRDGFVRRWLKGEATPPAVLSSMRLALDDDDERDPSEVDVSGFDPDELRVSGDLQALVERAVDAFDSGGEGAEDVVDAAYTAANGGLEGIEALVAGSADGYAHPDAIWLLLGVLAPEDLDEADEDLAVTTTIETSDFDFTERREGTVLKQARFRAGRRDVRVLVDHDHKGAVVHKPPAFDANTVVGLDATGRSTLWEQAIGRSLEVRDIHETDRERRDFLRDVMNLQVVQTSAHVNSYEGNPAGKNFADDIALVDAVADEFGGQHLRQNSLAMTSKPGVITTKCVRDVIGEELLEAGAGAVENYGNHTGTNEFAQFNTGVLLGCQHYGDDAVEKWAALAGETVDRSGHGVDLEYGNPVADEYLQHMREDQVMQALMRFGRDEEGAVVFAHTGALREDLPVVAEAAVCQAHSPTAIEVGRVAKRFAGRPFTVSDLREHIDRSARSIRRALNEFADLGYLRKVETAEGRANRFNVEEDPGTGTVDLPETVAPPTPGQDPLEVTNTGSVRVWTWSAGLTADHAPSRPPRTVLPAPGGDTPAGETAEMGVSAPGGGGR